MDKQSAFEPYKVIEATGRSTFQGELNTAWADGYLLLDYWFVPKVAFYALMVHRSLLEDHNDVLQANALAELMKSRKGGQTP